MYLDYSKLSFDRDGNPETPELLLQTRGDAPIGVLGGVSNTHLHVKFVEPSELTFDVASHIDGVKNPLYDKVNGHKLVYTECYGVYLLMNPETETDGIAETKHVTAYSLEKELETKRFFLEEGTYRFYDNPYVDADGVAHNDSILGRALECAPGWSIKSVAPEVAQRYRTFDEYDDYLLPFLYNDAQQTFRCVFVFDTYDRTISVLDADAELEMLPIYLDFDNLLKAVKVEEKSDELATAVRPYGSDGLSIFDVNPIGSNWMYDLSYFIESGDIPKELGEKWTQWQRSVLNQQSYYHGLCALRASAGARLLAERSKLTELEGELTGLTAQQSVVIQSIAIGASTSSDLSAINNRISAKNIEIAAQEALIADIEEQLDENVSGSYASKIKAIADSLNVKKVFGDDYETLAKFFIEQDITDESFVATSVDADSSGESGTVSGATVSMTGSSVYRVSLDDMSKTMYLLSGGKFAFSGDSALFGDIIRGTIEVNADNTFVMSFYAGTIIDGAKRAPSGMITLSGTLRSLSSDVAEVDNGGVITYEGTSCTANIAAADLFVTYNVSDYQNYAVQLELFDYAAGVLEELSSPTYEFTVDAGNFIFAQEFSRFREKLALGKGVYLRLHDEQVIKPYIIEFEIDFENRSSFSILFSNRFKAVDYANSIANMIKRTYSSSRSIDASKHSVNQTVGQMSYVSRLMQEQIDSAKNTILAARNQSVIIDGAGIHISCDDADDEYIRAFEMRMVNGMLAMSRDNWNSVDVALGVFKTSRGYHTGINAHVLAGDMLIGHDLIIENPLVDAQGRETGVMQFKIDSSGAWLNNSTFILQKDNGGKMIIDPKYGLVAGTGNLFSVDGTTVTPTFVDGNDEVEFDDDGMPKNTNFYIDSRDGSAYFRGIVYANAGKFAGELVAASGTFKGTVQASKFLDAAGNDMMNNSKWKSDYLDLGNIILDGKTGDISMKGNLNLSQLSSITWNAETAPVKYQFSVNGTSGWHTDMSDSDMYRRDSLDGGKTWGNAYQFRGKDGRNGSDGSDATVNFSNILNALKTAASTQNTFITATKLGAPNIYGANIYGAKMYANDFGIYPEEGEDSGTFTLYAHNTSMFSIEYLFPGIVSFVTQGSGWIHGNYYFMGNVDFSNATVTGLDTAATFG